VRADLYSELAKDLLLGTPLRLEFLVVTKAKMPAVKQYSAAVDPARIQRTKRVMQSFLPLAQILNYIGKPPR
jgi:hypothetical protein